MRNKRPPFYFHQAFSRSKLTLTVSITYKTMKTTSKSVQIFSPWLGKVNSRLKLHRKLSFGHPSFYFQKVFWQFWVAYNRVSPSSCRTIKKVSNTSSISHTENNVDRTNRDRNKTSGCVRVRADAESTTIVYCNMIAPRCNFRRVVQIITFTQNS